jgi:heat shock protein HslJ
MLRRPIRALLAAAAILPMVGACTRPPPPPPPPPPAGLEGTSWVLRPDSLDVAIPAGHTVTATFRDGMVSGLAACNSYRASYEAGPSDRLALGDIVTTRRACEDPILRAEQAFTGELRRVGTYRIDGGELRLGDGRAELLRFTRATVAPAGGPVGDWRVTRYMNAGDGLSSPLPGTAITLSITAQGQVSGRACNGYGARWTGEGGAIRITDLVSELRACTTPPGVMQQEDDYFTALRAAQTWRVAGSTLTLAHPRGTSVVAERVA